MGRWITAAFLIGALAQTGCQSGWYPGKLLQGGGCGTGSCLGGWSGPSTIAPPATYSLQIPGAAGQAYYGQGQQLPAGQGSGWTAQAAAVPGNVPQMQFGQGAPAQGGAIAGAAGPGPQFQQVAVSPTAWPGGGTRMISPDFASTRIDERMDASRLPLADASGMQAPGPFNQAPLGNRMATASMPTMPNPGYSMPNAVQPGNPAVASQWTLQTNPYQPQPQQPTWVLAESSTRDMSRDPNYQAGWRDRVPQSGTLNR